MDYVQGTFKLSFAQLRYRSFSRHLRSHEVACVTRLDDMAPCDHPTVAFELFGLPNLEFIVSDFSGMGVVLLSPGHAVSQY